MADMCGDNRFEIIAKAKEHLLEATNIDTNERVEKLRNMRHKVLITRQEAKDMRSTILQTHIAQADAKGVRKDAPKAQL